jgi:hypothetical protein
VIFDDAPSAAALLGGHVKFFSVDEDLCRAVSRQAAALPNKPPNSMHKYGKVLLPTLRDEMHALVQAALPPEFLDSISHIHAFDIKYLSRVEGGHRPIKTKLGLHVDDSTWTINVCVNETDFSGCGLMFTGLKHPEGKERAFPPFTYRHAPFRGVVHRGFLQHSVSDLTGGSRESIIIWVSCARAGIGTSEDSTACGDGTHAGAGAGAGDGII